MATKKPTIPNTTNYKPRCMNRSISVAKGYIDTEVIERPGQCIGRLLALQQVDGVDGLVNTLFKGQYDDAFGVVDPATDIRVDPHSLQDALLKEGYQKAMSSVQKVE